MKIDAGWMKVRGKIAYVFLGIAFLGLTYPLLGDFEGGRGDYETLKIKTDPGYFLNFRCPLAGSVIKCELWVPSGISVTLLQFDKTTEI